MIQVSISVRLTEKESNYLIDLKLDSNNVLQLDVHEDPPYIVQRLISKGIINSFVSDWGMQYTGYAISPIGEQILQNLKSRYK